MSALILIPARMAATRLPGKPLADIAGKPMIVRVVEQAVAAGAGRVAVAAGDPEIAEVVRAHGGEAVMTDPAHPSGSDRVKEAADRLDPERHHDIIVNLQGDLPTLPPALVTAALEPLTADQDCDIATLAVPTEDPDECADPSVVKAVIALAPGATQGRALYFTRATAPSGPGPVFHHLGIYAFRRAALDRFVSLPPSPLEQREKLEQLRALEAGMRIGVSVVDAVPVSVDTPADLAKARKSLSAPGARP